MEKLAREIASPEHMQKPLPPPSAKPPARMTLDEWERQVDAQLAAAREAEMRRAEAAKTSTAPISAAYQQTLRGVVEQGTRARLPIPDRPPALNYVVTKPVDPNRPAAQMAAELVQLANTNRVALTGEEITPPVQKIMQTGLMNTAERPPSSQQLQSIAKDCATLGLPEVPEMSTMLQASLWRAYNAPNRVELLEATTGKAEALLAPQQSPAQAASPSFDDGPSFGYDSGPSIDF